MTHRAPAILPSPPERAWFAIERKVALAAIRAADKGHDPLRIGALHCEYGQDTHLEIVRRLVGVNMEMALDCAADIAFQLEPVRTIPERLQTSKVQPLDRAFAHMLAHAGVDPIVVAWLVIVGGTLDIDDLRSGYRLARVDNKPPDNKDNRSEILCDDRVVWTQRGLIFAPALPDTLVDLCAGRPLKEVVSHPVLDPLPITISQTEQRESITRIHTDHAPSPASVDDLVQAMTRT